MNLCEMKIVRIQKGKLQSKYVSISKITVYLYSIKGIKKEL